MRLEGAGCVASVSNLNHVEKLPICGTIGFRI